MYLDDLKKAAEGLFEMANNRDVTPDIAHGALFAAKRTLERLQHRPDFLDDLNMLDYYAKYSWAQFKNILESYDDFLTFFISEQELLIRQGLPPKLVFALATEARTLWDAI